MTAKKTPIVQQMAAPAPEVVEKAQEKQAAGNELSAREQKALDERNAQDQARGYREIDVRYPNGSVVHMFQSLVGEHTAQNESEMIAHVQEQRVNAASSVIMGH